MKRTKLFRIIREDFLNTLDCISQVYSLQFRTAPEQDWKEIYTAYSEEWIKLAYTKYDEYLNIYLDSFINGHLPVMFEVGGQVYKTEYLFWNQSCIVGSDILGNQRYSEFNTEPIKFDYVKNLISFYNKGTALVKSNQLFIDGQLIADTNNLYKICQDIEQDITQLNLEPDKLISWIAASYPGVISYSSDMYSRHNIKKEINK